MDIVRLLKTVSLVSLVFSGFFVLDWVLPLVTSEAQVISTHRPLSYTPRSRSLSKEEVIIDTTKGRIKVFPYHLDAIHAGDSVVISQSFLCRIGKKIYLKRQGVLAETSNFMYSWFSFLPVILIFSSVLTLRAKEDETIQNFGAATLVIVLFALYIVVKDYFR
ncbi:hypothetical protein BFP72_08185 [Reichenbachiella sp. 5M10]|uniref:hypothetical protein n=1 Tax=Reichenbachiella sp. 5M10 TaxID=1889772 RepID=UPI000C149B4A|nr:hypothetical protein [Reichenbachiella sp. 5M10]PIB35374.1 hypothetical protein BFP72_08185 [Reichenbachiella sp. 5M10]